MLWNPPWIVPSQTCGVSLYCYPHKGCSWCSLPWKLATAGDSSVSLLCKSVWVVTKVAFLEKKVNIWTVISADPWIKQKVKLTLSHGNTLNQTNLMGNGVWHWWDSRGQYHWLLLRHLDAFKWNAESSPVNPMHIFILYTLVLIHGWNTCVNSLLEYKMGKGRGTMFSVANSCDSNCKLLESIMTVKFE